MLLMQPIYHQISIYIKNILIPHIRIQFDKTDGIT